MDYLYKQYLSVTEAVERGGDIGDTLAIKWYVQHLMAEQIARYIAPASSVLEVGCGGSLTLHFLSARGYFSAGADRDPRFVQYSAMLGKVLKSRAVIVQGDAFSLPFHESSFDYVYSVGMLEHYDLPRQRLAVKEMCRVSRNYVHIEIPNSHPLSTFYTVGRDSAEVHMACNPGILLAEANCTIVDVDGRCAFDTLNNLRRNAPLLAFALAQAPTVLRDTYQATDIPHLCAAEQSLSKLERLIYGFQLSWVAQLKPND